MRRISSLLIAAGSIVSACNQPPRIDQVGDQRIASSFSSFLFSDAVDAPYFEVYPGELLTFTVVASDPDEDVLMFSAGPLPIGATFDETTGVFSWLPELVESYGGGLELYLVVQDDAGEWDSVVVYLALVP